MGTLLIRGGRVVDPSQGIDRLDDLLVRDGLVVAIGNDGTQPIGRADETIDATGLIVAPGLIETGMTKPIFDRAREKGTDDKIGQLNALRRAGQPEEIAKVALFLASDDASYVNGQVLPVDGGLSSSLPIVPPKR